MNSQWKMRGLTPSALLLAMAGFTGISCKAKVYPDADTDALAALEGSKQDAGGPSGAAPVPAVNGSGENRPPVTSIDPGAAGGGQSGGAMLPATCSVDAGTCGDAGPVAPVCVPTGPRDCTSDLDNDCDGQPDNILDAVCVCALGSNEACDEHPDFDGKGLCKAGTRTCVVSAAGLTTEWSACEGAVGPGEVDSCTIAGDDTDCDGAPNSGCTCVDDQTQPCGSTTDTGPCQIGTSTCVNGVFGQCVGAVAPAARDTCVEGDDSNCNGIPNEGCTCVDGQTQACGSTTDTGPCQIGTRTCINGVFGQCVGAVAPAARDTCGPGDDASCNGIANEGCTCINGQTQACGQDVGSCQPGTRTCANGNFGQCVGTVGPGARDCTSPADNDCDGRPDNTIDNVCTCVIGSTRTCGTHPQDGTGQCRAGQQSCVAGPNNASSAFAQACTGAVGPGPRNCSSPNDNDCDGEPDNTIDNVCECRPGGGNGPCSDDANNPRCNSQGQCAPCQTNADCALVSGGRDSCDNGACIAPAEPFDCEEDSPPPSPLPSARMLSGSSPAATGGTIANGTYILTQVDFYGAFQSVPGEGLEFQDGFMQRGHTTYLASSGDALTGFSQVGTYVTTGTAVAVDLGDCQLGNVGREIWGYSASGGQLQLVKTEGQVNRVETYLLQP